MALEKHNDQHHQVVDKFDDPTDDYTMDTRDYVVRASSSAQGGDITITLPRVSEAEGRFYSLAAHSFGASDDVMNIQDRDDSEYWTDLTISATGDLVLLYSDGRAWHNINND